MKILSLKIEGMSCASCASSIENSVIKINGVRKATVNYAMATATFDIESEELSDLIKEKIISLGFKSFDKDSKDSIPKLDEIKENLHKFLISIVLALSIFSLAMWPFMNQPTVKINWYLQFFLCFPIWAWVGLKFQKSLIAFLRTGRSNMNTLIGLGTSAAFLYSAFITIFTDLSVSIGLTQKVYFEAVGFIISFVFLGQYFEEIAKKKTTEALNSLLKLSSKTALILKGEEFLEVSVEEVITGDILRVKPGEKLSVDGLITKGESNIDESMISGEPLPVFKKEESKVFAGTINGERAIEYKATKVGQDTFLSQIVKFVEDAQNSKPAIQKYADKISSYFTPVVLVFSIITFLVWYFSGIEPKWGNSISSFIAVLVIACPCALGLATPTAVVVSTGRASLKGILIGGGEVIEKAVGIDTIIFDKTGTITEGKPTVVDYILKDNDESIVKDIASIEQFSEHPLSKAIVKFANDMFTELLEPDDFEIVKGKGIVSEIESRAYIIGKKSFLEERNIIIDKDLESEKIGSLVYVAKDDEHVASLVIGDKIKDTSKEVISQFNQHGIETWMITGDNEKVASVTAQELGISNVLADALPLDKAKKLEELQSQGKKVAMVGDGINDAPALAKAHLSLAMGTGTDVAMNASDVTLVNGDLSKALDFLLLSEGTMKIIKQNLFLSMIYNTLLIPIAAGVLVLFGGPMMPPILASVAMGLSSISVVSNSLRIKNII